VWRRRCPSTRGDAGPNGAGLLTEDGSLDSARRAIDDEVYDVDAGALTALFGGLDRLDLRAPFTKPR
jgi:hypothetical protein